MKEYSTFLKLQDESLATRCILMSYLGHTLEVSLTPVKAAQYLCRGVRPCPTSILDMTSDDEAPVLELWRMWSTPSLLPGPLWPGVVTPDLVLSMSQQELFDI